MEPIKPRDYDRDSAAPTDRGSGVQYADRETVLRVAREIADENSELLRRLA